jgi:hypothetical protein
LRRRYDASKLVFEHSKSSRITSPKGGTNRYVDVRGMTF